MLDEDVLAGVAGVGAQRGRAWYLLLARSENGIFLIIFYLIRAVDKHVVQ